jgi:TonB-linked SusC/RagA family outer membrane protein
MKQNQKTLLKINRKIGAFFKTWMFLMLFMIQIPHALYANGEQSKVSINVENTRLEEVLDEIHKQTNFNFIYNDKFLKNLNSITLDMSNAPLNLVLDECLKGTKLTYEIQNGIVVLVPIKPAPQIKKVQKKEQKPIKVSGTIIDERGITLPGVTILIKGTQTGLSSTLEGYFAFEVDKENASLQFSFIGMETLVIPVKKMTKGMKIILREKSDNLDEVVVTGFIQTTKRKITGSVAVITQEAFKNRPLATVDNILQGQVAGVSSSLSSGRPGETAKIRIRGTNTLSGNAEPLWVVDGVPLQSDLPEISSGQIKAGDFNDIFNNGIAGINPNDIENVTILKDASAAAIYGSRAAGGVIVITTKRGKVGKMQVNYSTTFSVQMKPQKGANFMNAKEKLNWEQHIWDEFSEEGYNSGGDYPVIGIVGMIRAGKEKFAGLSLAEQNATIADMSENSTDWLDLLFQNSISQSHYLSMSGGQNTTTYYVSLGYSDNQGLVKKTDYSRYTVNAKINMKPSDKLNIGFTFDLAKQESNGPSMNVDPFKYAYFANPYETPYNDDGSYRADYTYSKLSKINGGYDPNQAPNGFNILREMNETSSLAENFSSNIRASLNYTISEKLSFNGLAAYSFTNNGSDNINGIETSTAYRDRLSFDTNNRERTYGSITQSNNNNNSYNMRGYFNYRHEFDENNKISALAGSEVRGSKSKSTYTKRYGYDPVTGNSSIPLPYRPSKGNMIDYSIIESLGNIIDGLSGQSISETSFASFYASFDYYYSNKYALSTSFRVDGSNNFGSNEQFNPTWSLGGAWHISEEDFMYNYRNVINRLSLKVATGYTGNINKSVSPQLIMDYNQAFRKIGNQSYRMGSVRSAPNPNLKWEQTRDMKIGLEFALFNSRISGLTEAYYRLSTAVVSPIPVSFSTGFSSQGFNTSEIENKGLEFSLSTVNVKTKDFTFRSSFNIAWNVNKLKKINAPEGTYVNAERVGYPLGSIFGGKVTGIDPVSGLYTFKLRPDAKINSATDLSNPDNYKFYLGTSTAPVTGGFSVNLSYKNISMNLGGSYSIGAKIENNISSPVSYSTVNKQTGISRSYRPPYLTDIYVSHLNVPRDITSVWTPENPNSSNYARLLDRYGDTAILGLTNPSSSTTTRGAFLEDVSFLRFRSVSLSYSLPDRLLRKLKLSSVSFTYSVNNILTWTNYSGIDPETPGAVYPISRSMSFGFNVGF